MIEGSSVLSSTLREKVTCVGVGVHLRDSAALLPDYHNTMSIAVK